MSVSAQREAEVAEVIHDLTYRGKQVPPGHARAIARLLNVRGMLAPSTHLDGADSGSTSGASPHSWWV